MRRSLFYYQLPATVLLWSVPVVLVSAVMALWNTIPQLRMLWANTVGTPLVTCGCETLFSVTTHPYLTAGLIAATLISSLLLVRFVWLLVQQYLRTRRFVNELPLVSQQVIRIRDYNLTVRVVRLADALLCTVGIFRPRVIISLAQLRLLNAVELRAALVHEQMHIRFGHVWKRSVLHAFIRTVAFIPSMRTVLESIDTSQELQADEATLSVVNRRDVLSALTQCFTSRPSTTVPQPIPLFAAADLRLQHLLSLPLPTPVIRPFLWALGSVIALMLSSLFFSKGLFLSAGAVTDDGQQVAACMQEFEDVVESPAQSVESIVSPVCIPTFSHYLWVPTQPAVDQILLINYTP